MTDITFKHGAAHHCAVPALLLSYRRPARYRLLSSLVYISEGLTVQLPAWLHGLARLEPVFGLFNVLAPIRDLSAPPAWRLVLPWISTLALGGLVWHLSIAAQALREDGAVRSGDL